MPFLSFSCELQNVFMHILLEAYVLFWGSLIMTLDHGILRCAWNSHESDTVLGQNQNKLTPLTCL